MNPTTANYDQPWQEALSHLENGFLEETRFLEKTKDLDLILS